MYMYVYIQTSLERADGGVICSQQRIYVYIYVYICIYTNIFRKSRRGCHM